MRSIFHVTPSRLCTSRVMVFAIACLTLSLVRAGTAVAQVKDPGGAYARLPTSAASVSVYVKPFPDNNSPHTLAEAKVLAEGTGVLSAWATVAPFWDWLFDAAHTDILLATAVDDRRTTNLNVEEAIIWHYATTKPQSGAAVVPCNATERSDIAEADFICDGVYWDIKAPPMKIHLPINKDTLAKLDPRKSAASYADKILHAKSINVLLDLTYVDKATFDSIAACLKKPTDSSSCPGMAAFPPGWTGSDAQLGKITITTHTPLPHPSH